MKKAENFTGMDERQSGIIQKSIVAGFLFLILCLLVATVYRIAVTGDAGWELFAIIGAAVVILIARRIMGDVEQPLDYKNRPLPTGNSKADRIARCKSYLFGSVWFGLAFGVMDTVFMLFAEHEVSETALTELLFPQLSKGGTVVVTALLAFVLAFLVSFAFDYLIGEFYKVRRYNRLMNQLDSEENEA